MATVKFGDVVKEVKVNIDRSTDDHEFFIAGEHMDSNEIHIRRRGRFADSDVGPAFIRLFKPGQVLYGSRRTYLKKVAVADFEGITSNTTFVLETKDQSVFMQELLPYLMLTDRFTDFAVRNSKGSTNPYILFKDIAAYEFELPEYTVQQELVTLLTAMDATSEAYKKLLNRTDALVQSQFVEMFGAYMNAENSCRMDSICERFCDGDWIESKDQSDSGIRLIQTGNVGNGCYIDKGERARFIDEATFKRLNCTAVRAGDILVSRLPDPIGRACIIPESVGNAITAVDCTIIRLKENLLPEYFVAYTLTAMYAAQIDSFTTGSTRKRISRANLGSVVIPVPPTEAQKQFAAFAEQLDKSKFVETIPLNHPKYKAFPHLFCTQSIYFPCFFPYERKQGKFFQLTATLSSNLAEARLSSLVAWA